MKTTIISRHALLLMALKVTLALGGPPPICMLSPALQIEAGSVSTATIEQGRLCDATLTFQNPDFRPVHFDFKPLTCLGFQQAEITIPKEVPNGDAFILWQCAGQETPTCNHAWITGGLEDSTSIVLEQHGTVSCLVPTGTLTSLSTSFGSSTTRTDTFLQTEFSTLSPSSISTNPGTAVAVTSSGSEITILNGKTSVTLKIDPASSTWMAETSSSSLETTSSTSLTTTSSQPTGPVAATDPTKPSVTGSGSPASGSTTSLFSTSSSASTSCPISCSNPSFTITQTNVETVTVRSTSAVTSSS